MIAELSEYPVCTMLEDKSADVNDEIEIQLTPVGEITHRDCEGIEWFLLDAVVSRKVACQDECCCGLCYGYYGGGIWSHGHGVDKGDAGAKRTSHAFSSSCARVKEACCTKAEDDHCSGSFVGISSLLFPDTALSETVWWRIAP